MAIERVVRHLLLPDWWAQRSFSKTALAEIERAVGDSETRHRGELRVAIEAGLTFDSLWVGQTARQRAEDLFAQLRVWDTEENSGVLIYLQLIDQRVEIIADRGIHACVGEAFWATICRDMEAEFRAGRFKDGTLAAIRDITLELSRHFPADASNRDELPNRAVLM